MCEFLVYCQNATFYDSIRITRCVSSVLLPKELISCLIDFLSCLNKSVTLSVWYAARIHSISSFN